MKTLTYCSISILLFASAAFAQTGGRQAEIAKIRADCRRDMQQFCRTVEPGGGRIIQCLLSHRSSLASACRSDLLAVRSMPGLSGNPTAQSPAAPAPAAGNKRVAAGNARAACGADAQRLCAGVSKEDHGVVKCLVSHRMELSARCRSFFEQMRAHQTAPKSALTNNPPPAAPTHAAPAGSELRASCGPDAQRLCAGVSKEDHGVVKCLVSHRTELSAICRSFFEQMRARRAAKETP
jgi:hypothetical protein